MAQPVDLTLDTQFVTRPVTPAPQVRGGCLVNIYPSGPALGRRYPLGDAAVVLGRGDDCDVPIADRSASRLHARVEPGPGGYVVSDLGSTNGTFVNDRSAAGLTPLHDGDYLRVGNCIYRYLAGGNVEADYHEEIYRLTIHDALTRVSNRRALTEFLDREVTRSRRHHRPLSLLLLDIDRFKAVNDRYGHLCGDMLLRDLADRVRPEVREEDLFARFGGEEFALALVETPHDRAVAAAERVREVVAARPFRLTSTEIAVTVSVGVATTAGAPGVSAAELIRLADERLYEAKGGGRNRVAGDAGSAVDRPVAATTRPRCPTCGHPTDPHPTAAD